MKKSIFNLALLSMLFVLGSCSTTGNDKDTSGGTGDPALDAVIDEAIKDAVTQIGSVEGMDRWFSSYLVTPDSGEELKITISENRYFSANEFKKIDIHILNGKPSGEDVTFDNDLDTVHASKGTLAISTDTFKLFDSTGAEEITDKKRYTTLYTQTFTKSRSWHRILAPMWEDTLPQAGGQIGDIWYYIVKKTDTELSMIYVGKKDDGTYFLYNGTMDEEIADAITYTKK